MSMIELDTSNKITHYSEFGYWFHRVSDNVWWVTGGYSHEPDLFEESNDGLLKEVPNELIQKDFQLFRSTRPEYLVGNTGNLVKGTIVSQHKIDIPEESKEFYIQLNQIIYEYTLLGTILVQEKRKNPDADVDVVIPKLKRCLDWLESTDFYTCPASTIYHESFRGGLCSHTLQVVKQISMLKSCKQFSTVDYDSASLVALVHDWCKIGLYKEYIRNVKNEDTGRWEPTTAYKYADCEVMPLGHGVASMYLAQNFFRLTVDQCLAIRWHMGAWRVCPSENSELQHSNENYPLVHMLQFADQLAITNYS